MHTNRYKDNAIDKNDFIDSDNIVIIDAHIDQYTVLMCARKQDVLIGISIDNMIFDGLCLFNLSRALDIETKFTAKPVYEYAKRTVMDFDNWDYIKFLQKEMTSFHECLNHLHQTSTLIGVESVFQDDAVMDIGYITDIIDDQVFLACVSADGILENESYSLNIGDIIKVDIASKYLNVYQDFLENN